MNRKVYEIGSNLLNMTVKITYFVHGTTTDNEKEISSGWYDIMLSEKGIKQSIDLKKQVNVKKFDVVFCSDLKRAVKSAELTFKGEVPIIQDKRLRECNYGQFNAKPSTIVAHKAPQLALDVLVKGKTWEQAFAEDWRKKKAWQPGWEYTA